MNAFLAANGGPASNATLNGSAIGSGVAALLLLLVGLGILCGSRGWRLFVVIVEALNMAYAIYLMAVQPHSSWITSGLVTLLIGVSASGLSTGIRNQSSSSSHLAERKHLDHRFWLAACGLKSNL